VSRLVPVLLLVLLLPACGGDSPPVDAGLDAGLDAGTDAGPPDAGPMCEPVCVPGEACCGDGEGGAVCTRLASDARHCGSCGVDCEATRRGDSCIGALCACGEFLLGCIGSFGSACCVPPPGEGVAHCADLARDFEDCGACNQRCDIERASRCDGASCVCGDERRACAGTATDRCCEDRFERSACVDTSSDREHCGRCGVRCGLGLRCVASECVPL
jgi:hypothetical protein